MKNDFNVITRAVVGPAVQNVLAGGDNRSGAELDPDHHLTGRTRHPPGTLAANKAARDCNHPPGLSHQKLLLVELNCVLQTKFAMGLVPGHLNSSYRSSTNERVPNLSGNDIRGTDLQTTEDTYFGVCRSDFLHITSSRMSLGFMQR